MNTEKVYVASEFVHGSKLWGTADAYSDEDIVKIVYVPLEETLFSKSRKNVVQKEDITYYSFEGFIERVFSGRIDSLLLLSGYLRYGGMEDLGVGVPDIFERFLSKFENFDLYVKGNMKNLMMSALGMSNQIIGVEISGKKLIQYFTALEMIERLLFVTNNINTISPGKPEDFVNVGSSQKLKSVLKLKRLEYCEDIKKALEEHFGQEDITDDVILSYQDNLAYRIREALDRASDGLLTYQEKLGELEYKVKKDYAENIGIYQKLFVA